MNFEYSLMSLFKFIESKSFSDSSRQFYWRLLDMLSTF